MSDKYWIKFLFYGFLISLGVFMLGSCRCTFGDIQDHHKKTRDGFAKMWSLTHYGDDPICIHSESHFDYSHCVFSTKRPKRDCRTLLKCGDQGCSVVLTVCNSGKLSEPISRLYESYKRRQSSVDKPEQSL